MNGFGLIGIMGALEEEIVTLKEAMQEPVSHFIGGREYVVGKLFDKDCVVVFSRCGKVAAAATSAILITKFGVDCILFTGVAGAISASLNIGDVVLGTQLYQHDMDATPLFEKREIPYLNVQFFQANSMLIESASRAAKSFFTSSFFTQPMLRDFSIEKPQIYHGIIASGDQFVSQAEKIKALDREVPGTLAVEMEGASVAQVCFEHEIPFMIVRTISDKADHLASIDFPKFASNVATHYSMGIVKEMFKNQEAVFEFR